jgi:hypothetical protein
VSGAWISPGTPLNSFPGQPVGTPGIEEWLDKFISFIKLFDEGGFELSDPPNIIRDWSMCSGRSTVDIEAHAPSELELRGDVEDVDDAGPL